MIPTSLDTIPAIEIIITANANENNFLFNNIEYDILKKS